ncbi:hypothetical protein BASA60_010644 [Batrachochytrium salamandrivorans]|nr:hypothetical protein BASA60_010644 [Batrachochytrium salamandrivorans]KAH6567306.1 hypothetical protein BASA62_006129 [Batrachochytrium salamandrivorans]
MSSLAQAVGACRIPSVGKHVLVQSRTLASTINTSKSLQVYKSQRVMPLSSHMPNLSWMGNCLSWSGDHYSPYSGTPFLAMSLHLNQAEHQLLHEYSQPYGSTHLSALDHQVHSCRPIPSTYCGGHGGPSLDVLSSMRHSTRSSQSSPFPSPKLNSGSSLLSSQQYVASHHHRTKPASQSPHLSLFKSDHPHEKASRRLSDSDLFFLNLGKATQVLRDDLPAFFEVGLTHTEIYSPDIVFSEPYHSRFESQGITYYRSLAEIVRVSAKCIFENISFHIVSIRQVHSKDYAILTRPNHLYRNTDESAAPKRPDDEAESGKGNPSPTDTGNGPVIEDHGQDIDLTQIRLVVKWSFEGRPRLPSLIDFFKVVEYQGVFEYKFDATGRIVDHHLVSIHPVPPIFGPCRWFKRHAVSLV